MAMQTVTTVTVLFCFPEQKHLGTFLKGSIFHTLPFLVEQNLYFSPQNGSKSMKNSSSLISKVSPLEKDTMIELKMGNKLLLLLKSQQGCTQSVKAIPLKMEKSIIFPTT